MGQTTLRPDICICTSGSFLSSIVSLLMYPFRRFVTLQRLSSVQLPTHQKHSSRYQVHRQNTLPVSSSTSTRSVPSIDSVGSHPVVYTLIRLWQRAKLCGIIEAMWLPRYVPRS